MQDQLNADECCKYLKALGDPERLRIVECLQQGPKAVGDISRDIESAIANVSHHLKQLRFAGLVHGERHGRNVVYSLAPQFAGKAGRGPLKTLDFGCCRIELGKK
jgi:DNA-binding transcriptional ArsR family regulator